MKKILPIVIIGIMLLSVVGATATNMKTVRSYVNSDDLSTATSGPTRDYTHTVMVEVGTANFCPSCPASNAAWHSIYEGGNYDFEYCEMVVDENSQASSHMNLLNLYWVPTSYFDGGENVEPGTSYSNFYNFLDTSGARPVPDLVASMTVDWIGHSQLDITVDVVNNEIEDYIGNLRVYVIELESTHYEDYSGNPYYHAFLDFAINDPVTITGGDTYSDAVIWDKTTNGFPNLLVDNVQVILAVSGDEPHQSYADPYDGNNDGNYEPFMAYYIDETIAVIPDMPANEAPEIPHIDGTVNGKAGEEYTYSFCTTDPDDDIIYYWVDWGDGCPAVEWIGPFPSGVCMTLTHNWTDQGDYTIKAKAMDPYGAETDWGYLDISMPLNHQAPSWFFQLLQKYPRLFPVLRTLIGA
jgi:hypothetical protein